MEKLFAEMFPERREGRLNFADPEHRKLFFDRFGGEEQVKRAYPLVHRGVYKAANAPEEEVSDRELISHVPSIRTRKAAAYGSAAGPYLCAGADVHYPQNRTYSAISGKLMDERGYIYAPFSTQSKAKEVVNDQSTESTVYLPDLFTLNDHAYSTCTDCYSIKNGQMEVAYDNLSESTLVHGDTSLIQKFSVQDPHYTNIQKSDRIIILYARGPLTEELNTWDYQYKDNKEKNKKVHTFMKVGFTIELAEGSTFANPGYVYGGYKCALLYHGDKEITKYKYDESAFESRFTFSQDRTKCTVTLLEDWNDEIDTSNYGGDVKTTFHLQFRLSIQEKDVPIARGVDFAIRSTGDSTATLFEAAGQEVLVPYISMRWGCFCKDTRIRMADGSEKRVADVRLGERVMLDNGAQDTVQNIYSGMEDTLLRIQTEDGSELRLTGTHPILTERGCIAARSLRPGDVAKTESGDKRIVFINEIGYNDTVYNLELSGGPHFLIANGFFAGDFIAQNSNMGGEHKPRLTVEEAEQAKELGKMLMDHGLLV